MIKIRNKRIALLLVLAMLATMFVGVGTASAASNFIQVDSSWTFVEAGEDGEDPGNIDIKVKDAWPAGITSVGYVVTLKTEGVNFSDTNSNEVAVLGGLSAADFPLTLTGTSDLLLDIDDEVTGAITVDVRVYGKIGAAYAFDETETQTIAKVDSGVTSVSVGAKKTVQAGEDGQQGSTITIKEGGPTAFDADEEVTFSILTAGVEWDGFSFEDELGYVTPYDVDETDKKIVASFNTNTAGAERIALMPWFVVSPSVEDGTEIKIKVSGDEITTTTVVVAVVGSTDITVKVADADKDFVYRGQAATFDDVSVKLNPGGKLDVDWVKPGWFTITLPEGLKWQYDPVDVSDWDIAHFEDFEDQGQTIWFDVTDWSPADDGTLKLTNFAVVADANAVVGDLSITFDGCVEGTYKIGSIKNAFTIETVPFALTTGAVGIQGAKIVITETEDEALKLSHEDGYRDYKDKFHEYDCFDIVLPAGVSFVGTPEIDVTDGDIEVDWDDVDDWADFRVLRFDITETSSQAGTIEISGLEFSVLSQPGLGDLKALVAQDYNIASQKALETLVIGAVATNPTAVYVIGAPTFTVNGAVESVVAPSYIKNGRTYLAIRDIATGLGIAPVNVLWDAAASKVTLIKGAKIVQVTIGSNVMNVNGVAVAMDVAPEISNGRTMLPAAFIAQAFGATASWDAATQTVTIK